MTEPISGSRPKTILCSFRGARRMLSQRAIIVFFFFLFGKPRNRARTQFSATRYSSFSFLSGDNERLREMLSPVSPYVATRQVVSPRHLHSLSLLDITTSNLVFNLVQQRDTDFRRAKKKRICQTYKVWQLTRFPAVSPNSQAMELKIFSLNSFGHLSLCHRKMES